MTTEAEALTALKGRLRRALGNLTTAQFSDDQCTDAVSSAINEYSKNRPVKVLDFLTTVEDQALYDLSSKTGIMKVKEVFYSSSESYQILPGEIIPDYSLMGRLEGISIFENPSIWLQYMQRLEQYKEIFQGDFEYESSSKMLRLIPAPSLSGQVVYYVWNKKHTALTIPEEDVDTLLLWARGEAKETISSKKAVEVQSVSGYGESVSFGASAADLIEEAADLKAKFQKKFGSSFFTTG